MIQLEHIINQFELSGDLVSCEPFGNGHINDTYLIEFNEAERKVSYVLQRINRNVFKQPEYVVHNIEKVLNHFKQQGIETLKTFSSNGNQYVIGSSKNLVCSSKYL